MTDKQQPIRQGYEIKAVRGSTRDVDVSRRRVSGYFSHFDNFDDVADSIAQGAFRKSIRENGPDSAQPRIFHLWQHDPTQILGKPEVLKEDKTGLYYETAFPDTTLGNDTLKLYESGVLNEHSIGFQTLKSDLLEETDANGWPKRVIREVKLWEGSTVTWGANSLTPFTGFKSLLGNSKDNLAIIADKITRIDDLLHKGSISDEFGVQLELLIKQLTDYSLALQASEEPAPATQEPAKEPQSDQLKTLIAIRDLFA